MVEGSYLILSVVSLALGLSAGFIMHRSDFCIAGAFRDLFLFRRGFMLRMLLLLVVSTMLLIEAARLMGLTPLYPFPLLYSPTPANLIGGFLFGVGMVLAGGCVIGTLYKIGAGSVLSALAFVGLAFGSALYAEVYPYWVSFIKSTTFFAGAVTVPQLLGVSPTVMVLIVSGAAGYYFFTLHKKGALVRRSTADGYLQPWRAALMLSVISLLSYVLIGMPMGVTSSAAKLAGYAEGLLFKGHVEGLAFFKAVPLNCTNPLTGIRLEGGGGPKLDSIAAIQFPLVLGIILGSAASALKLGEFKINFSAPPRQYVSAFAGGTAMGLASRLAPTCNVWHLMGGLPILAMSSMLFLIGLLPGAWLGGRLVVNLVMNNGGSRNGCN